MTRQHGVVRVLVAAVGIGFGVECMGTWGRGNSCGFHVFDVGESLCHSSMDMASSWCRDRVGIIGIHVLLRPAIPNTAMITPFLWELGPCPHRVRQR